MDAGSILAWGTGGELARYISTGGGGVGFVAGSDFADQTGGRVGHGCNLTWEVLEVLVDGGSESLVGSSDGRLHRGNVA